MTERDSMPVDEQRTARRALGWWVVLQGYAGLGAALMSGLAFGLWQGSAMAGLWMACVLIGVPLSLGGALTCALVMSRTLTASVKEGDD
jgi:hypothetical protein